MMYNNLRKTEIKNGVFRSYVVADIGEHIFDARRKLIGVCLNRGYENEVEYLIGDRVFIKPDTQISSRSDTDGDSYGMIRDICTNGSRYDEIFLVELEGGTKAYFSPNRLCKK